MGTSEGARLCLHAFPPSHRGGDDADTSCIFGVFSCVVFALDIFSAQLVTLQFN